MGCSSKASGVLRSVETNESKLRSTSEFGFSSRCEASPSVFSFKSYGETGKNEIKTQVKV